MHLFLHFSADEKFDGTYQTNVVVSDDGSCLYVPPGLFKSTCIIGTFILQFLCCIFWSGNCVVSFLWPGKTLLGTLLLQWKVCHIFRYHLVPIWRPKVRPQVWQLDIFSLGGEHFHLEVSRNSFGGEQE